MVSKFTKFYYTIKPVIPRSIQLFIRKRYARIKRKRLSDIWPINTKISGPPPNWRGWPDGKKFAFVLSHDVDTARGMERCLELAEIEQKEGFRSIFNFVPERYDINEDIINKLKQMGFEVGVHGLKHDGKLFASRKIFLERAKKINYYLNKWNANGFRAPAMHHNLDWLIDLDIIFDMSTFDTDPFEPQPEGVGSIFPFILRYEETRGSKIIVELPYTLPQDFTLFVLLGEKNANIWEKKTEWIASRGGMVLLNVHPDYLNLENKWKNEEYPADMYITFLRNIKYKFGESFWNPLPGELADFWLENYFERG